MSEAHLSPSLDPTPGSKWWRVDFHTHTPFSKDAYLGNDLVTPREWLLAHMDEGIDAVVVSDHNGGGWIEGLKAELNTLRAEKPQGFRELYLFPGVEITTSQNVHVLVILDSSSPATDISRILQVARYRGVEGCHETAADSAIFPFIEEIQSQGIPCLVIPAHANGKKGILEDSVPFDTRKKIFSHSSIYALECQHSKNEDWDLKIYGVTDKGFATVYGSDSHKAEEIGRRTTWVRMQSPTLDGLRIALLDGKTSVKEYIRGQPDPGPNSPYFIERVVISETKFIGRRSPQEIRFNPAFNAIIGGRGTGKSSILELIRTATKRGSTLRQDDNDYGRNYRDLIDEITLSARELDPKVAVDYRQHGQTFRMVWKALPPSYELFSIAADGSAAAVTEQGVWSERFPLRIFSQKQLYAFKEHTGPLLEEIDSTPEVSGADWERNWENKVAEFIQLSSQIHKLKGEVGEQSDLKAKLEDLQRQIDVLEKAGHKQVLRELSLRRRQRGEIDRWEEIIEDFGRTVEETATRLEIPSLNLSRFPDEDGKQQDFYAETELEERAAAVKSGFDGDLDALQKLSASIKERIGKWEESLALSPWETARLQSEKSYGELIENLQGKGEAKPEQYGELVQSRQLLKKRLDTLSSKSDLLEKAKEERKALYLLLRDERSVISVRRKSFLDNLFSQDANLRATLVTCGDVGSGILELRSLLARNAGVADAEFESFVKYLENAATNEDRLGRIDLLKMKLIRIANAGHDAGEELPITIRAPFINHLANRTTEDKARLLAWFPPDLLKLRYRKTPGGSFNDLEKGSPGQVAAAVLAFLLAYGDEPILLDQPEDDLDNRLIYDLIVKEIQTNKLRRQLLIVTHNPNILVNGNADLVIPIEEQSGLASIPITGSLQDPDVRKTVCDIMEGGRQALERRFRRIVS